MRSMNEDTRGLGDLDPFNLERRLSEIVHELNLKRVLLDESRHDLNDAVLAQHELERSLDNERRDAQETRIQLELAVGAARRCEEEKTNAIEGASRQSVQLEAAVKERDALRDQARTVQLENVNLRRTVEEQEGQLRCQLAFQQSSIAYQSKIRETVKELNNQIQKLEQDHHHLGRTVEAVQSLCSRLQMGAKHYVCMQEKEQQQRRDLEQTVIALRAELEKMHHDQNKTSTKEDHYDKCSYNIETYISELKARLAVECEGNSQLNVALEGALKAVTHTQEGEVKIRQDFLKLEHEYKTEKDRVHSIEEENNALRNKLVLIQSQLVNAQEAVQMERDLHKKSECNECGVQTDIVPKENSQSGSIHETYKCSPLRSLEIYKSFTMSHETPGDSNTTKEE